MVDIYRRIALQRVAARVHRGVLTTLAPVAMVAGQELEVSSPYLLEVTSISRAVAHLHCGSRLAWVQESDTQRDRAVLTFETTRGIVAKVRKCRYGRLLVDSDIFEAAHTRLLEAIRHFLRVHHRVNRALAHRHPRAVNSPWKPFESR